MRLSKPPELKETDETRKYNIQTPPQIIASKSSLQLWVLFSVVLSFWFIYYIYF